LGDPRVGDALLRESRAPSVHEAEREGPLPRCEFKGLLASCCLLRLESSDSSKNEEEVRSPAVS